MSENSPVATVERPLLLQGAKAGLALMRLEDVSAIARWSQDLEFTANIGTPGESHTLEMRQEAFDRSSRVRPDSVELAVIDLASGALIGFGGLFDITRALTATLFVGIGEGSYRQKGYGTEAVRLICEYAFFFRSLNNIKVEIIVYNWRAIRLYERVGFRAAERVRGAILLNGSRYDLVMMVLLRPELELRHTARFRDLERWEGEAGGPPGDLQGRAHHPVTARSRPRCAHGHGPVTLHLRALPVARRRRARPWAAGNTSRDKAERRAQLLRQAGLMPSDTVNLRRITRAGPGVSRSANGARAFLASPGCGGLPFRFSRASVLGR